MAGQAYAQRTTYQKLARDENQDSLAFQGRLGIQRRDGVLNLLERKALEQDASKYRHRRDPTPGRKGGKRPTESFSTIAVTPRDEADSKVSIELSRYIFG